VKIWWS